MDALKGLLGALGRIEGAMEGVDVVKETMRIRMKDYRSVLQELQGSTPSMFHHELERLQGLFEEIEDLHRKNTAGPEDCKSARIAKRVNRGIKHESIGADLDAIDREIVRQFTAIAAKSSINTQAVNKLLAELRPPALPDTAAVPAGAAALPRSFVERSGVRAGVDGLLNPEKPLAPYAIVGMGGSGKTVLASAVVHDQRVREHFRGGIFWMRVGRGAKRSLLPLLQGLAREMGAAPTEASHVVPHVFDGLEHVKQHLAAVATKGIFPSLVVLDDVWEREAVDALVAVGLKVLVTTRDRSVVGVPGCCLELGGMTEDEALELLLKTSMTAGHPGNEVQTQMTKVFELCGGLPLVLAIAGSMPTVKGKGLTPGAWRELIKTFTNVATKMETCGGEMDSLNMVLETSFNALAMRKKDELKRVAVLAAGAVAPVEMLLNLWEMQDEEGTREEAEGLVSKCLLQDLGGGRYGVHDLVLEFLKIKTKGDPEKAKRTAALQAQYLGRRDVVEDYGRQKRGVEDEGLFSLAALWRSAEELSEDPELAVASYRASLKELDSSEATADVASYSSVGFLFIIQCKYAEAGPLFERAQVILEKALGPEHPDVAATLHNRAYLLERQGKYADAELLYKGSQAIWEKTRGPEHRDVAVYLNSRAMLLQIQGKYAEAGQLFELSQVIGEKTLDPEHPDLAAVLHNRAGLLSIQGKHAEAESLLERAQGVREKVFGPEHPIVAASLNSRANLLKGEGKYSEAGSLYERSQAIVEKVLGPEHLHVATALNNRAGLLASQGRFAEAASLCERSKAIREKILGSEHPDVATSLNDLASLLESQGKYAEAEPLYEQSLALREKALGPEHPHVAVSLSNLALLLERQGKYAEAALLYERANVLEAKVLCGEHPGVATSLSNRASLLKSLGKYAEAEQLFERSLTIREKALGPDHPAVAILLNNRAGLLEEQGKYAEAQTLYERAQDIAEKTLGNDHPSVAKTLNNRASSLQSQGNFAEAEQLYTRSQAICEKALGPKHPDIAHILNNRASLLESQGKDADAEALYKRSQTMREEFFGPEHPSVAASLNNRASLLFNQAEYAEAQSLFGRSQAIWVKALGPEHPHVATSLNNLAELLIKQGKYAEAEPLLERAQAIREKAVGPEHPDVASSLIRRVWLMIVQGKRAEAKPLYERARAMQEKALDPDLPAMTPSLNNRGGL